MPTAGTHPAINLRAREYFIARAMGTCRCCNRSTAVYAVGLTPGHEVLEVDEGASAASWSVASHTALLFHIDYLAAAVGRCLAEFTASYRFDRGAAAAECWANHCEHCDAPFDDQELFCEPGGVFLPTCEAEADRVQLIAVNDAFAANAAGYAHEPTFFGRGGI